MSIDMFFKHGTQHFSRIRRMMQGFGQRVPEVPEMPDEKDRISRGRLILEELLEYLEGAALQLCVSGDDPADPESRLAFEELKIAGLPGAAPNFVLMADALTDLSVVTIGSFVSMGIPDGPLLELVDENNLLKIARGHLDKTTGKFIKPADHQPPDIANLLLKLGCSRELVGLVAA
jgi:predicted HAD superfamily Cof-like phosphohydrolase